MTNYIKKDIRTLSVEDLKVFFESNNIETYRANQIYEWLWVKGVSDFNLMTNLSIDFRKFLQKYFTINNIKVESIQKSIDGTIKNAVKLYDNKIVESVLIPTKNRITACISSQVGCSLNCKFCATSKLKRLRNLNVDEIFDQVKFIDNQSKSFYNRPITNIVYMGMGEPLMNYENVIKSIEKITSKSGLGFSPRRITVSSVGFPKFIKKMADQKIKFNLAISLHSAIQSVREFLMPFSNKILIEDLIDSLRYWINIKKSIITFEYIVFDGINDSEKDIIELIKICKKIPSKVNLIQYNSINDDNFRNASIKSINRYSKLLSENNIINTIRKSRGDDIDAACGQLANNTINLNVSEDELSIRRDQWSRPNLELKDGVLTKYQKLVSNASNGCITT